MRLSFKNTRGRRPTQYDRYQDRRIKRLERQVEKKEHIKVVSLSRGAATATWVFLDLNNMAQGDTDILRDGAEIQNISISGRLTFDANVTEEVDGTAIRYVVIYQEVGDGGNALPAGSDIFTTDDINGLINRRQITQEDSIRGNNIILLDRHFNSADNDNTVNVKFFIKVNRRSYWATTAAAVSPDKGRLIFGWCIAQNIVQHNVTGQIRLLFEG